MLSHPQATFHAFRKTDGVQVNNLAVQDNFEDFKMESVCLLHLIGQSFRHSFHQSLSPSFCVSLSVSKSGSKPDDQLVSLSFLH